MLNKAQLSYILRRSGRKTLVIEIRPDLTVLVRAPHKVSKRDIDQWVLHNRAWIEAHLEKQKLHNLAEPVLTLAEIARLKGRAQEILPAKVDYYARLMGLKPEGVKVTSAAKRYGSCSTRNKLCFSFRVMLLPEYLIDYIVIHELAHIRYKNHGCAFYNLIEQYLPDYRDRIKELKSFYAC